MERKFYILWFLLNDQDSYLISYTDEADGVVVDPSGAIPCFSEPSNVMRYAENRQIDVDAEEPILLNLDAVETWLKNPMAETVEPNAFLGTWNLFADVSRSIAGNFDADQALTKKIYNKLFWGCNLPSVTPAGRHYQPAWTKREVRIMRQVLGQGMEMFKRNMIHVAHNI